MVGRYLACPAHIPQSVLTQWSDLLLTLRARKGSKMAENQAFPAPGAAVLVATEWVRSHFPQQHCGGLPAEPWQPGLAEGWAPASMLGLGGNE